MPEARASLADDRASPANDSAFSVPVAPSGVPDGAAGTDDGAFSVPDAPSGTPDGASLADDGASPANDGALSATCKSVTS